MQSEERAELHMPRVQQGTYTETFDTRLEVVLGNTHCIHRAERSTYLDVALTAALAGC